MIFEILSFCVKEYRGVDGGKIGERLKCGAMLHQLSPMDRTIAPWH